MENINHPPEKIWVIDLKENRIWLPVATIIRCNADGDYTWTYLDNHEPRYLSHGIGELQKMIAGIMFFRIEKSHLIHIVCLKNYWRKGREGVALMPDGKELPVSRRKRYFFDDRLYDLKMLDENRNFSPWKPEDE